MRMAPATLLALVAIVFLAALPALAQYGGGAPGPAGNQQPYSQGGGGGAQQPGQGELGDIVPELGQKSQDELLSVREHDAFADAVDLSPLRKLAVFHGGRAKILDTLARETVQNIHGRSRYERPAGDPRYRVGPADENGVATIDVQRDPEVDERRYDSLFTFMDLVLNGDYYIERPLLFVSHVDLRRAVATGLPDDEQERVMQEGRVAPRLFFHPAVQEALAPFQRQSIRAKQFNTVMMAAQTYMNAGNTLMLVSPAPNDDRWPHLRELAASDGDERAEARQGAVTQLANYGGNAELNAEVIQIFRDLARHWQRGNAVEVNALVEELAAALPQVNPGTYPGELKRNVEYLYNITNRFTYAYLAYFVAFVALMLAFAAGWNKALLTGGVFLSIAFIMHTLGLVARIALSDRWWTIHNQFESFFMLTWFAALAGLILLLVKRQWIYAAAASAISAIMLMVANQVPIPSSDVAPVAGILATSNILYVHVNIMIISYALIALALILSIFYLITHYSSSEHTLKLANAGLHQSSFAEVTGGGGATGDDDPANEAGPKTRGRAAMLNDLDQAQMVVIQMVFWLLAVGILLGAYWADHSWGRWWAWDPKETWALILWIVFLVAVHLRVAVKRRGLVTAWMSVLGFFMMIWTHWGVNLLLAGLHSYA
ncbi:MAG: cytochrome c biogenesis protein CcsA [Phycisphaeraceae bacterium]